MFIIINPYHSLVETHITKRQAVEANLILSILPFLYLI